MSHPDSLAGETVGNYTVEREIGRGGMGVVYKARETSLGREVALKVLHGHLSADMDFVRRFEREARAAAQLTHPNIVEVYAAGVDEGMHFIAMEYVKGHSLTEVIREKGRLEVAQALDIAGQAAEAFAEAHKQGIIHRDIKPRNLMVDLQGRVKVLDFGLAKALQGQTALTAHGTKLGTPMYMSPEQCQAEDLDRRTDVYSLGVTLYEMLAGAPPYSSDTPPLALMYQIAKQPFPDIRNLNPKVPRAVAALIARMTAKDRTKRHGSAGLLSAHLEALTRGETPDTFPTGEGGAAPELGKAGVVILGQPVGFWLGMAGTVIVAAIGMRYQGSQDRKVFMLMALGPVLMWAGIAHLSNRRFVLANELAYLATLVSLALQLLAGLLWSVYAFTRHGPVRDFCTQGADTLGPAGWLLLYVPLFLLAHRIKGVASLRKGDFVHIPVVLLAVLLALGALDLAWLEKPDTAFLVLFPAIPLMATTILYGLFAKGGGPLATIPFVAGSAFQLALYAFGPTREALAAGSFVCGLACHSFALWALLAQRWKEALEGVVHAEEPTAPKALRAAGEPVAQIAAEDDSARDDSAEAPSAHPEALSRAETSGTFLAPEDVATPSPAIAGALVLGQPMGFWLGAAGITLMFTMAALGELGGGYGTRPVLVLVGLGAVLMGIGLIMLSNKRFILANELPYLSGIAATSFVCLGALLISAFAFLRHFNDLGLGGDAQGGCEGAGMVLFGAGLAQTHLTLYLFAHRINRLASLRKDAFVHIPVVLLALPLVLVAFALGMVNEFGATMGLSLAALLLLAANHLWGLFRKAGGPVPAVLVVAGVVCHLCMFAFGPTKPTPVTGCLIFGYGLHGLALWVLLTQRWKEALSGRDHPETAVSPKGGGGSGHIAAPMLRAHPAGAPSGLQAEEPRAVREAASPPAAPAAGGWRTRSVGFWIGVVGVGGWMHWWLSVGQSLPSDPWAGVRGVVPPTLMLVGVIVLGGRRLFVNMPLPYVSAQGVFVFLAANSTLSAAANFGVAAARKQELEGIAGLSFLLAGFCLCSCLWMLAHQFHRFSWLRRDALIHVAILMGSLVLFFASMPFGDIVISWAALAAFVTFLASTIIGMWRTRPSETYSFLIIVGAMLEAWPAFIVGTRLGAWPAFGLVFLESPSDGTVVKPFCYGMACHFTAILLALDQGRGPGTVRSNRLGKIWFRVWGTIGVMVLLGGGFVWHAAGRTVDVEGLETSDAALEQAVNGFRPVRKLVTYGMAITDKGMAQIGRMTALRSLDLNFVPPEAEVERMWTAYGAGARAREELGLESAAITDTGVAHLASLRKLEVLDLSNTHVTDAGLAMIAGIPAMEELHLDLNLDISDAGVAQLGRMGSLKMLSLAACPQITSAGIAHLRELPRLEGLSLVYTPITDAAIPVLKDLKQLRWLLLGHTAVSDAGVEELRSALPGVNISK